MLRCFSAAQTTEELQKWAIRIRSKVRSGDFALRPNEKSLSLSDMLCAQKVCTRECRVIGQVGKSGVHETQKLDHQPMMSERTTPSAPPKRVRVMAPKRRKRMSPKVSRKIMTATTSNCIKSWARPET